MKNINQHLLGILVGMTTYLVMFYSGYGLMTTFIVVGVVAIVVGLPFEVMEQMEKARKRADELKATQPSNVPPSPEADPFAVFHDKKG